MLFLVFIICLIHGIMRVSTIESGALLVEPPQRSSLWRFNLEAHINVKDGNLNCGGYEVQWESNGGKCGVCGDPFWGPLNHDDNGVYASGTVVRSYEQGSFINVTVEVLSNLMGYFEFRLCPRNSTDTKLTNECFEQNLLWIEESWGTRYYVGNRGGIYDLHVRLPENIVCSKCVFQWKYSTGYRMGGINSCECNGCGRQEQFYNCADVEIKQREDNSTFYRETRTNVHTPMFLFTGRTSNLSQSELALFRDQLVKATDPAGPELPFEAMPHSHTHEPHHHHHHHTHSHSQSIPQDFFNQFFEFSSGPTTLRPMPRIIGIHVPSSEQVTPPAVTATTVPLATTASLSGVTAQQVLPEVTSQVPTPTPGVTEKSTVSLPQVTQTVTPTSNQSMDLLPPVVKPVIIPPPPVRVDPPIAPVLPGSSINTTTTTPRSVVQGIPIPFPDALQEDSPTVQPQNQFRIVGSDSIVFPIAQGASISRKENGQINKPIECNVKSPSYRCRGKGAFKNTRGISEWCLTNCKSGFCVVSMCECGCQEPKTVRRCQAIGPFAAIFGMDAWCQDVCSKSVCPPNLCNVENCVPSKPR